MPVVSETGKICWESARIKDLMQDSLAFELNHCRYFTNRIQNGSSCRNPSRTKSATIHGKFGVTRHLRYTVSSKLFTRLLTLVRISIINRVSSNIQLILFWNKLKPHTVNPRPCCGNRLWKPHLQISAVHRCSVQHVLMAVFHLAKQMCFDPPVERRWSN